ncbi:hypothetical protein H0R92_03460 [Treponema sp. OMZ 840]|uniref:hypothetical protein n=1 Tax=Treponema sp. OMZ 840 TaxID=244313 RepID=UPI003D8E12BC
MKKIFLLLILQICRFLFANDKIELEIKDIINSPTNYIISVVITNNTNKNIYLHEDTGHSLIAIQKNVLFYAPNYSFCTEYFSSAQVYDPRTLYIKSGEKMMYKLILDKTQKLVEFEMDTGNVKECALDFNNIEYINLMLVFMPEQWIPKIFMERQYKDEIRKQGFVIGCLYTMP